MSMATDPYAAIRNLAFTPKFELIVGGRGGAPIRETFDTEEEAAARNRELGGMGKVTAQFAPDMAALTEGGFNSKYNRVANRGDGTIALTMQQPGAHKYDTAEGIYTQDPETGQWSLQGDPTASRQQSSAANMGQAIGTGAAFFAAPTLGPALSGALGGGILGGAGAGAIIGGVGSLAGGANSDEALRGAVTGGLLGGVTGGINDYMQGPKMPGLSDFDLSPRPGIDMASLPQQVGMPNVPNVPNPAGLFGPIDMASLPQPVSLPSIPAIPEIGPGILPPLNNTVPTQQDTSTIEIVAKRPTAPVESAAPVSNAPALGVPMVTNNPSAPIETEGRPRLSEPAPDPEGGMPPWLTNALKNPQIVGALAGGLLGGTSGGGSGGEAPYTGPMPTIERGNWKPNAQATMMQVPQFGGLLPKTGQANSGLWRFGS